MAKKPDRLMPQYRNAVLILGMHRSGTSALARVVSFLGAAVPAQLVPANESNPRGQWECAPLLSLQEQMLAEIGSSWDDWRALPARWRDGDIAAKYAGKFQQTIDAQYSTAGLLMIKDPRMCRTLPFWMHVLEKTGIRSSPLIIVRNPLEVAESLRERDGISFEKAMLLWLRHYLDAEHETRHLPRNIITLDALLEDWKLIAAQSASRLGLHWPRQPLDAAQDVREFLDMELHNHRATMAELEAHTEVPSWVKSTYRALVDLCDGPKAADPKRELDRVRFTFSESARVFGVVAFAQTDALKQAEIDVAEAKRRAEDADTLRAELSQERQAHSELAVKHQSVDARAKTLETEAASTKAKAEKYQKSSKEFETALIALKAEAAALKQSNEENHKRAEAAEQRAALLLKEKTELQSANLGVHDVIKRVTTDAVELKSFAERLSKRTEWIEVELKKQLAKNDAAKAELEEARAHVSKMTLELKGAVSNAMAASKELSQVKEHVHAFETKAIKSAAEAKQHLASLKVAEERLGDMEAAERAAQTENAELRAELAEAWAISGNRPAHPQIGGATEPAIAYLESGNDAEARARRIAEDLKFERMHVQQLERRLNSWAGLASAALRKVTKLGGRSAPTRRRPASATRRVALPPAGSGH